MHSRGKVSHEGLLKDFGVACDPCSFLDARAIISLLSDTVDELMLSVAAEHVDKLWERREMTTANSVLVMLDVRCAYLRIDSSLMRTFHT